MRPLTILRPEPGASASVAAAKALGLQAMSLALFAVEPLDWDLPLSSEYDGLLLTSANAVRFGGKNVGQLRGLKVFAVGEATAQVARDAGFDIAAAGSAGVDRLLASIETEQRLLHLCGEHRTDTANVQHHIVAIPVYRSAELPPPDGIEQTEVAAIHSPRAARRFGEIIDQLGLDRSKVSIAAISKAAGASAGVGWRDVAVAKVPEDSSLLALAKELCDKT
jgi:uroporphyrinogen-III synthase